MKRPSPTILIASLIVGITACSDGNPAKPADPEPPGTVVSDAQLNAAPSTIVAAAVVAAAASSTVSYVSIEPDTYPDALSVSIRNRTTNAPERTFKLVRGGLDPVAIDASSGDELDLMITLPGGATVIKTVRVPAKRPPEVVRTSLPKGRIDVAVNSVSISIEVIFSEPIDPATITNGSLSVSVDNKKLSGSVRLATNPWTAEFIPDTPLEPLTRYQLAVTTSVHDLDGDALPSAYDVDFVTGASPCPVLAGVVPNSQPLSGCYVSVTESFPNFWLSMEQNGTNLAAFWGVTGDADQGDAQSRWSPDGTVLIGTVHLRLPEPASGMFLIIDADVRKAGSELVGHYSWIDPPLGGVGASGPIVLRKL